MRRPPRPSSPNILGICCSGHGAALALVSRDFGVRAMTFERYVRARQALLLSRAEIRDANSSHDPLGIWALLRLCNGGRTPAYPFEDVITPFCSALLHGLPLTPEDLDLVVGPKAQFALSGPLAEQLERWFPCARSELTFEHHEAHRFQAFLASPFSEAAVLTIDTCGEWLARLGGRKIAMTFSNARRPCEFEVLAEHLFPESSAGLFYSQISYHLGFLAGEEGKTMGLAAYGGDRYARELLANLELRDDGSFRFVRGFELQAWLEQLGPARPRGAAIDAHWQDLAYAAQAVLERVVCHAVEQLSERSLSKNLCLAGGVALNSVANQKAFARSRFERIYVCPNSGDTGQALGCALAAAAQEPARGTFAQLSASGLAHDYLGPVYPDARCADALSRAKVHAERHDDLRDRADIVARWLSAGLIVAHYCGGSEYGPRALGHRSILADPRDPGMKDHLNARVKHRESFRPFAPAVLSEAAAHWYEGRDHSPFMLQVVDVLPARRSAVPAITHVDGSARVQSVHERDAPELHAVISAFARLTDVPMLLNTSFNVAGEPIVETPEDALRCYLSTQIDALALGPFLVGPKRHG